MGDWRQIIEAIDFKKKGTRDVRLLRFFKRKSSTDSSITWLRNIILTRGFFLWKAGNTPRKALYFEIYYTLRNAIFKMDKVKA